MFLAEREPDRLPVVLKVLDASGKATSENLSRFIQEYTLLSRIEHPHVMRIYDQGFTDDHAYIAMEYFEQGDLRAEITAGMTQQRVIADRARRWRRRCDAIHSRGIIHRDLKPENIMRRPDGSVALADFGIAKSMLQQENFALTQTRHGDVVGTPYYLSPEQASGQGDHAAVGPVQPGRDDVRDARRASGRSAPSRSRRCWRSTCPRPRRALPEAHGCAAAHRRAADGQEAGRPLRVGASPAG